MTQTLVKPWTGRLIFPAPTIRVTFYQGPLNGLTDDVGLWETFTRWGRLCLKVMDLRDPRGFVIYKQAKSLPLGYGVPERWMTVDQQGRWTDDSSRYHPGEYEPEEQQLPWEEYGAEGDPGGGLA